MNTLRTLSIAVILFLSTTWATAAERYISFNPSTGSVPYAGLIADAKGNLYGCLADGGTYGNGSVFEIERATGATKILYSFPGGAPGAYPTSSLLFDKLGNLYGEAENGGGAADAGVIFELSPTANGWTETVLHTFGDDSSDGGYPQAGLIFDASGNLYGTTRYGGSTDSGTIYELSPTSNGWTETVLYSFTGGVIGSNDGWQPVASLIFDKSGNLYGTTFAGGTLNDGTVFELKKTGNGWAERVLYSFTGGTDGQFPSAGLTLDSHGTLYGAAGAGGVQKGECYQFGGCGAVFSLTAKSGGGVEFTVLHEFQGTDDGGYPEGTLIIDAAGDLIGTAYIEGSGNSGVVFALQPVQGGWSETVLHAFQQTNDGANPAAGVIADHDGNLFGTTTGGGSSGAGSAYVITR